MLHMSIILILVIILCNRNKFIIHLKIHLFKFKFIRTQVGVNSTR